MARIATRPMNQAAVREANDDFYADHPELVQADGTRTPLDPCNPAHDSLREEWMDRYEEHGGATRRGRYSPECCEPTESCPLRDPAIFNARWREATVKCGDNAAMLASTRNIAAGTAATFTVKKTSDGSTITTVNANTQATSVVGSWQSQKPSNDWTGPEIKFTVAAAGVQADSQEPHLEFHRYANINRTPFRRHINASGFTWDQAVAVELNDRVMIIHVPIKIRKCGKLPKRRKNESWASYASRWHPDPYRPGTDDLSAADKNNLKTAIENPFRRQMAMHRSGCGRGNGCTDPVARKCCKLEIQMQVHFYNMNDAAAPAWASEVNYWNDSERANSANWFAGDYPGSPLVFAHEVGHLMGFYDEYTGGACDTSAGTSWQCVQAFTIPTLMNGGNQLRDYYFTHYANWIGNASRTNEGWTVVRYS